MANILIVIKNQTCQLSELISVQLTLALAFGLTTRLKLFPMIRVTTLPHHMLHLLKKKDSSVTLLRIKLPAIPKTQSLMLRDLLEENSKISAFKMMLSFGHSRLKLVLVINLRFLYSSKENKRSSNPKKFLQWCL